MKKGAKIRSFIAGALFAVVLIGLAVPAYAALTGKTITVYTGVNIFYDDGRVIPKDVNGNQVDTFIYNGTTYLPVRAVSNLFDTPIQWDGKTSSVYIGKHQGTGPAVMLKDLDYSSSDYRLMYVVRKQDNQGLYHDHSTCGKFKNTYQINGNYTAISGTLFQLYDYRFNTAEHTLSIYGDGKLLYTHSISGAQKPVDFRVDLTGVLELTVEFDDGQYRSLGEWYGDTHAAIADFGLWT